MFNFLTWQKISRFILVLSLTGFLLGTVSPSTFAQTLRSYPSQWVAQTNSGSSKYNLFAEVIRRAQSLLNPPRQSRVAGRARGGAGRGRLCPSTPFPVAAFVPTLKAQVALAETTQDQIAQLTTPETVFGKTIASNPTFWFYVPYATEEGVKTASFVLLDTEKHSVLPEPILIEFVKTPGVIEFQLPYSLEVDRLYNWYFSILCDEIKPSRNPGARGWIQRVNTSPALQTAVAADVDRPYRAYIEQGIWFEAVSDLARRYRSNRANIGYQDDWVGLLDFIERSDLQEAAIVECCQPRL